MDPRTSVISLPELAPRVGTSAAKSLKFPGPSTCTSELAPRKLRAGGVGAFIYNGINVHIRDDLSCCTDECG